MIRGLPGARWLVPYGGAVALAGALACARAPVADEASGAASGLDGGGGEAADPAWFALGQGERSFSPLAEGDALEMVLGSQGAWMFPIGVRGGGFALPEDPGDPLSPEAPRIDLWIDVGDHVITEGGHFAEVVDLPLGFVRVGDGVYESIYVALILPEVLADLRALDGEAARLHGELRTAGREEALVVDLPLVVRAPELPEPEGGSGGAGGSGGDDPGPHFVDATAEAGLVYVQGPKNLAPQCKLGFSNKPTGDHCQPERMIGGAAVGDVDGDGDPDLLVTRLDARDLLFVNHGGTFSEEGLARGLDVVAPSSGAAFGDLDNDGDLDLYVTTVGDSRYYLFVNHGGHFSEAGLARGAAIASPYLHAGMTPCFGDYDGDGFLDLHVGEWRQNTLIFGELSHARLLRNRGADKPGFFEDRTEAAGVSMDVVGNMLGPLVFSPAFVDLDDDGLLDLPVVSDFDTSRLFWNQGDGTFVDGTAAAGVGTDHNGMGSTFGDLDGDGRLDWFVSSIHVDGDPKEDGNRLYRNLGGRAFVDATDAAGVRDGGWGWGAAAFDLDNDGDLDLAQTGGWDAPGFGDQRLRLWRRGGPGAMAEVAQELGADDLGQGRGLVVFDYDDDGDLDLFVTHNAGAGVLLRNERGNHRGWLRVRAVGGASNRQGLGARVRVRVTPGAPAQVREIGAATHFMGQSEAIAHFGVGDGDAPIAEVTVEWPASGALQVFHDVPRRSLLTAVEPP